MLFLFFVLFSNAYVIVPPLREDVCLYNTFDIDTTFDLIYSNPISINKITNLAYIPECLPDIEVQESQCGIIREENSKDYSIAVYNCTGLNLEEQLSLLLDNPDNHRTGNIIAVLGDGLISLARQYFLSSDKMVIPSDEDYFY